MHYKCNNLIYSSLHHLLHVHVYFSLVLKNRSSVFPTRLDTNRAEQPQKMARGLGFRILKVEGLYYSYLAKTKALISCAVTGLYRNDSIACKFYIMLWSMIGIKIILS